MKTETFHLIYEDRASRTRTTVSLKTWNLSTTPGDSFNCFEKTTERFRLENLELLDFQKRHEHLKNKEAEEIRQLIEIDVRLKLAKEQRLIEAQITKKQIEKAKKEAAR